MRTNEFPLSKERGEKMRPYYYLPAVTMVTPWGVSSSPFHRSIRRLAHLVHSFFAIWCRFLLVTAYTQSIVRNRWVSPRHRKDHKKWGTTFYGFMGIDGLAAPVSGQLDCFTDLWKDIIMWLALECGNKRLVIPTKLALIQWQNSAQISPFAPQFQKTTIRGRLVSNTSFRKWTFFMLFLVSIHESYEKGLHAPLISNE